MTGRVRRLIVSSALALAAVAGVAPAQADAPVAAGWWYRLQSNLSPVAVPPPPDAPPDGLYVALDLSGPLAIAAVSYTSATTEGGTLTLSFASAPKGTPSIDACVATAAISGAQAGAWETKPSFDCDAGRAEGAITPDGTSIVFTLTSAFVTAAETIDAVLVPAGSAPFTAPIANPDESSFVAAAPATMEGDAGFVPDDGTSFEAEPGTSFDSGGLADPLATGGAFGGETPAPAAGPTDSGATGTPAAGGAGTPVAAPPVEEAVDQLPKVVAVGLLGLLGAAYWYLSNRPEPAPRLIGGLTAKKAASPVAAVEAIAPTSLAAAGAEAKRHAHPVGGLGRFARPRENLPNRL